MALRHRHHKPEQEGVARDDDYDEDDVADDHSGKRSPDDVERTPSSGSQRASGNAARAQSGGGGSTTPSGGGTLTSYIGSFGEIVRNLEMDDVYRYWSKLRDWLSDVPCLAVQQFSSSLPPSLAGIYYSIKPPSITPEQQVALDEFVESNVGIPYTHEQHWDLLCRLWKLSFPDTEVQPEQHDQQWKRLGFQGMDPATDFRSAGVLSVHALLHFAEVRICRPIHHKETCALSHGFVVIATRST
jgi:hypothetical protein